MSSEHRELLVGGENVEKMCNRTALRSGCLKSQWESRHRQGPAVKGRISGISFFRNPYVPECMNKFINKVVPRRLFTFRLLQWL